MRRPFKLIAGVGSDDWKSVIIVDGFRQHCELLGWLRLAWIQTLLKHFTRAKSSVPRATTSEVQSKKSSLFQLLLLRHKKSRMQFPLAYNEGRVSFSFFLKARFLSLTSYCREICPKKWFAINDLPVVSNRMKRDPKRPRTGDALCDLSYVSYSSCTKRFYVILS